MADLPRLNPEDAIYTPVASPNAAPIYNAQAKLFGEVGDEVQRISGEMSNANLYSQSSLLNQAKNNALDAIKADPLKTDVAVKQFEGAAQGIKEGAYLNRADKMRLNAMTGAAGDEIGRLQTQVQAKQARLTATTSLYENLPDQLQSLATNLISDPKAARAASESLMETAKSAALNGYITPIQYGNIAKSVHTVVDRHLQLLDFVGNGTDSEEGGHALTYFPGETNQSLPIKSDTHFIFNAASKSMAYKDLLADAHRGKLDFAGIANLAPTSFNRFMASLNGISAARGAINAGVSYPMIKKRVQVLNGLPANDLTIAQKAEHDQYQLFTENLKQGNFFSAMATTPVGASTIEDYNGSVKNIMSNVALTPVQKQSQLSAQYNQFANKMISLGQALDIPANLVKPVPPSVIAGTEQAFQLDTDPNVAIKQLNQYKGLNSAWLAASMKRPAHQETLYMAHLLSGTADAQYSKDMIAANQTGRDFSNLTGRNIDRNTILAALYNKDSDAFTWLSKLPGGTARITALTNALVNTVKYDAQQHNDLTGDNLSDYIDSATNALKNAYSIQKGTNFSFNRREVPVTDEQAANLSKYMLSLAKDTLYKGHNKADIDARLDITPLHVTNSPDGQILVVDSNGILIGSKPYSNHLMSIANQYAAHPATNASQFHDQIGSHEMTEPQKAEMRREAMAAVTAAIKKGQKQGGN